MFRKIFWINAGLLTIIFLLSYNLYNDWSQVITQLRSPSPLIEIRQSPRITAEEVEGQKPHSTPSSRMSYTSIIDKNLFRPDRTEWQPPFDDGPDDVPPSLPYPPYSGPKTPQSEIRRPNLFGTIIIGESKRYAIMQGWMIEEQQMKTRTIRLPDGRIIEVPLPSMPAQMKQDKINAYRIGDHVSGARIIDICRNKVLLEKENGERYELQLREPAEIEREDLLLAEGMQGGHPIPGAEMTRGIPGTPGEQPYPTSPAVSVPPSYMPLYSIPMPPWHIQGGGNPRSQQ